MLLKLHWTNSRCVLLDTYWQHLGGGSKRTANNVWLFQYWNAKKKKKRKLIDYSTAYEVYLELQSGLFELENSLWYKRQQQLSCIWMYKEGCTSNVNLNFNSLNISQSRLSLSGVIRLFVKHVLNVATMVVRKYTLEVTEEKQFQWLEHVRRITGNRLTWWVLGRDLQRTRRKRIIKQRKMDGLARSTAINGLTGEGIRKRNMWRNLVLGEQKTAMRWTILEWIN